MNNTGIATGSCEGTGWSSSRAATLLSYKNRQKQKKECILDREYENESAHSIE